MNVMMYAVYNPTGNYGEYSQFNINSSLKKDEEKTNTDNE
jgi:hypothetical protein